jgi:hypothetical protein
VVAPEMKNGVLYVDIKISPGWGSSQELIILKKGFLF